MVCNLPPVFLDTLEHISALAFVIPDGQMMAVVNRALIASALRAADPRIYYNIVRGPFLFPPAIQADIRHIIPIIVHD